MVAVIWGLLKIVMGLALVILLAYAFTRLATHRLPVSRSRGGVRVLGHVYLGGRRGVSLLKVGRAVLVLGVTDHQVGLLDRITDPQDIETIEEAAAAPLVDPERMETFRQIFDRQVRNRLFRRGEPGERE